MSRGGYIDRGDMRLARIQIDQQTDLIQLRRKIAATERGADNLRARAKRHFERGEITKAQRLCDSYATKMRTLGDLTDVLIKAEDNNEEVTSARDVRHTHRYVEGLGRQSAKHNAIMSRMAPTPSASITSTTDVAMNMMHQQRMAVSHMAPEVAERGTDRISAELMQQLAEETRVFTPFNLPSVPKVGVGVGERAPIGAPGSLGAPIAQLPSVPGNKPLFETVAPQMGGAGSGDDEITKLEQRWKANTNNSVQTSSSSSSSSSSYSSYSTVANTPNTVGGLMKIFQALKIPIPADVDGLPSNMAIEEFVQHCGTAIPGLEKTLSSLTSSPSASTSSPTNSAGCGIHYAPGINAKSQWVMAPMNQPVGSHNSTAVFPEMASEKLPGPGEPPIPATFWIPSRQQFDSMDSASRYLHAMRNSENSDSEDEFQFSSSDEENDTEKCVEKHCEEAQHKSDFLAVHDDDNDDSSDKEKSGIITEDVD